MWVAAAVLAVVQSEINYESLNKGQQIIICFLLLVFAPVVLVSNVLEILIEIIIGKGDGDHNA